MSVIDMVEVYALRAKIAEPVRTSFGVMSDRAAVFVRVRDSDGAHGWGEVWCNFPTIGAEHRARLVEGHVAPLVLGKDPQNAEALWAECERRLHVWMLQSGEPGSFSAALAGVDGAIHDLNARRRGLPLWRHLGGTDATPVPVYASGLNPGAAAHEVVNCAREQGFRAFKVKIGFGEQEDLSTLRPIARELRPGERMMVDVNQGWDVETASQMQPKLDEFPLHWVEEPLCADRPVHEWARVAGAGRSPLAGGENLRGTLAYHEALRDGYFAFVQPDACKWGGVSGTLPVARAVNAAGKVYCPHFLGGAVGLMTSLHLLSTVRGAGMLEVDFNENPLRQEVLGNAFRVESGCMQVPEGPGLGFDPDLEMLNRMTVLHLSRGHS